MLLIFANTATTSTSSVDKGKLRTQLSTGMAVKTVKVWTGSAWIQKPVRYWNGSMWAYTFNTGGQSALYEDTSDGGFFVGRGLIEDTADSGFYFIYDNSVKEDLADPGFYTVGGG